MTGLDLDDDGPESFKTAKPVPITPLRPESRPANAGTRQMPASEEAEQHVLACCLLDEGETMDRAIFDGISHASFYWPQNQTIFHFMAEMRRKQRLLSLAVLAEELRGAGMLSEVGGLAYLMQVTDKAPTTAHAGYMIETVRTLARKRDLIRSATGLVERAYSGDDLSALEALAANDFKSAPATQDWRTRRVRSMSKPPEPVTRLFLVGKPVATPGNLVTLISRAKTGKTATIGGAVAAIVGAHYDRSDLDTLGFTAPHTKEAVILIDTEQSPYDAYVCHSRAMTRARQPQDNDPEWLWHHALVGYDHIQLKRAVIAIIESAKIKHGGIFTIILDGVADFVASVNDEAESNGCVTWLRAMAVSYDCPIICVIHSNEGIKTGDDGRGHLGKQLARKAESNLLLKKIGEITTITSEKQRKAPITEKDGVAFRWSDEAGRHISCEATTDGGGSKLGGRPKNCAFADFLPIMPKGRGKSATRQTLYRYASEMKTVSATSFRDMLVAAEAGGEITHEVRNGAFYYYIPLPGE